MYKYVISAVLICDQCCMNMLPVLVQLIHKSQNISRKKEVYDVNFANTERLKKGSVITVKKYLNDEAKDIRKRNICNYHL